MKQKRRWRQILHSGNIWHLRLFYVFRPQDSQNPLEVMKKKHLYSKAADAYSVGLLASLIWKEE
jgi:hypothetical protein